MDSYINPQDFVNLYRPQSGNGLDLTTADFIKLYNPQQTGSGITDNGLAFYRSTYKRQRGNGLGSFFSNIWHKLVPFAKNELIPFAKQFILPSAKRAVSNLTDDIIDGKNIKQSIKARGKETLKGIGSDILNQSGSGTKRRKKSNKQAKKQKLSLPLAKATTIFD